MSRVGVVLSFVIPWTDLISDPLHDSAAVERVTAKELWMEELSEITDITLGLAEPTVDQHMIKSVWEIPQLLIWDQHTRQVLECIGKLYVGLAVLTVQEHHNLC